MSESYDLDGKNQVEDMHRDTGYNSPHIKNLVGTGAIRTDLPGKMLSEEARRLKGAMAVYGD